MPVYKGKIKKRYPKRRYKTSLNSKVKKILKKEIAKKEEYKNVSTNGNTDATTTANLNCLTEILAGTSVEERVGNEVISKSLDLRYDITLPSTPSYPVYVRCLIIRDTQGSKANDPTCLTATSATDLILNPGGVNTYNHVVQKNILVKDRYIILYDKLHKLSVAGPDTHYREYYKKFKNQKVKFYDDGATDREKGHLWFIYFSNFAAGVNAPKMIWYSRFKFTEM